MNKELIKKIKYYYSLDLKPKVISKITGVPVNTILIHTMGIKKKDKWTDKNSIDIVQAILRLKKRYSS